MTACFFWRYCCKVRYLAVRVFLRWLTLSFIGWARTSQTLMSIFDRWYSIGCACRTRPARTSSTSFERWVFYLLYSGTVVAFPGIVARCWTFSVGVPTVLLYMWRRCYRFRLNVLSACCRLLGFPLTEVPVSVFWRGLHWNQPWYIWYRDRRFALTLICDESLGCAVLPENLW